LRLYTHTHTTYTLVNNKGITLAVLIATVTILAILSFTVIGMITGENGLFSRADHITKSFNNEVNNQTDMLNSIANGNYAPIKHDINNGALVPSETTAGSTSINFHTDYGTIEVLWLSGNTNNITQNPNAPVLSGMTPVKWETNVSGWNATPVPTTENDPEWYSYNAVSTRDSTTNHTIDNLTSKWANAKNTTTGGDSYFVWIPRYAYRITYYESETSTEPTGYYDGYGMWRASDGKLRLELDDGAETVEWNGKKYIVHPAFCNGTQYQNGTEKAHPYDLGEWSSNISGFWVAKYEMSRTGATDENAGTGINTTFISVPNVRSVTNINIGSEYTAAKNYDRLKESHMMKNSEWGAVAYLTHSQYGRNGNTVDKNNSSDYITGNGGGSSNASITGTKYAYNTTTGARASTTGNVYGIYDMSGGAWENVAIYNKKDTNNYESLNGSSFASVNGYSDMYATKYYNETSSYGGNSIIFTYGKIGDVTKEVNRGGINAVDVTSSVGNWFGLGSRVPSSDYPFINNGGMATNSTTGLFGQGSNTGGSGKTFRVVLCL